MRAPAAGVVLALLAACRGEAPPPDNGQGAVAAPAANEAAPDPPANSANMVWDVDTANFQKALRETANDGLDRLTPAQRRAYLKGMEDCQAGRYDPDPWPEAYRLGCAAVNDR
jgi:hypothetical protein